MNVLIFLLMAVSCVAFGSTVTTAEWSSDADSPVDVDGVYTHLINLDPTADNLIVNSHELVPSVGVTNNYTIYRGSSG
ncbi:hypothetical protein [Tichowtungia aerotolerans]|uniref:Uncharacterized protein n=1 Tax=Tichowtungia aerotolerans TaxID=2697043 RepID=A0A6P1MH28_9BACT|nr:hypothetical protein [Tichowtungia aerotolerans]QHI70385.1 hypothetical protein GT409_13350 [Tichowtungia aerotolerans]